MTEEYGNEKYDDEEIILAELLDDELVEQMYDDLYDGLADEIAEGLEAIDGALAVADATLPSRPRSTGGRGN